jgi:hypothetical protein
VNRLRAGPQRNRCSVSGRIGDFSLFHSVWTSSGPAQPLIKLETGASSRGLELVKLSTYLHLLQTKRMRRGTLPFSIIQHGTDFNKLHTRIALPHRFPCSKRWRKRGHQQYARKWRAVRKSAWRLHWRGCDAVGTALSMSGIRNPEVKFNPKFCCFDEWFTSLG